jgi:hypothetical protein
MPSVPELCLALNGRGVLSSQARNPPRGQPHSLAPTQTQPWRLAILTLTSALLPLPAFFFFFFFLVLAAHLKLQLSLRRQSRAISIPTKHHLRHGRFRLLFASRSPIHPPHASPSLPASCLCLSCCAKRAFRLRGDADPRSGKEGPRRHRHPRCPREARGIPKRRCGPLNYNSKTST